MAEIAQTFSIDPYAAERSKIARQQKFAELLQSQALQPNEKFSYAGIEAPVSAAGGLAKALQAGMSGYLQGDAARKEDAANIKQETDYNAANDAYLRGMTLTPEDPGARGMSPATEEDVASRALSISQGSTAPPLTLGEPVDVLGGRGSPGTEGTPGTAAIPGSYTRAMTELSGLTGNRYATQMNLQVAGKKYADDQAESIRLGDRAAKLASEEKTREAAIEAARILAQAKVDAAKLKAVEDKSQNELTRGTASDAAKLTAEASLRSQFNQITAIKNFGAVSTALNSLQTSQYVDTKAADLALVYGLAKILDPDSVVRESEVSLFMATGSPAERLKGLYNSIALGKAALTQETRQKMMDEAETRAAAHEATYNRTSGNYRDIAVRSGLDFRNIAPDIAPLVLRPTTVDKPTWDLLSREEKIEFIGPRK